MPDALTVVKLKNGEQNNIQGEAGDACALVMMFDTIAQRVGRNLNIANWVNAVNNFGKINIYATTYASLHTGKYDSDDTFALVSFDSTLNDFKPVSPILDASKG